MSYCCSICRKLQLLIRQPCDNKWKNLIVFIILQVFINTSTITIKYVRTHRHLSKTKYSGRELRNNYSGGLTKRIQQMHRCRIATLRFLPRMEPSTRNTLRSISGLVIMQVVRRETVHSHDRYEFKQTGYSQRVKRLNSFKQKVLN